jgi:hypothetical protein
MAGEVGFGLFDVFLIPWTAGVLGNAASGKTLPRIIEMDAGITRSSTDLEAGDIVAATHTFAKAMEGTLDAGGINAAALKILEGGTFTTTGASTTLLTTYVVKSTDAEEYFKIEAQVYADDGGDQHFLIWKAKATNGPTFNPKQGEFIHTNVDWKAIYDDSVTPPRLYTIVMNGTVTPIVKV